MNGISVKGEGAGAQESRGHFVDASGQQETAPPIWNAFKVAKEEIDTEVERLKSLPTPVNGRRQSYIVHPSSRNNSITPGIRAALEVLLPGESIELPVKNSSSVGFCIEGVGEARLDRTTFEIGEFDVWSVPNMAVQSYRNNGAVPHVRLVFSDAPLLEQLHAHFITEEQTEAASAENHYRDPMADFVYQMPTGGGAIKTYHAFIDPEVIEQSPHLWKWEEVKDFLNSMEKDQPDLRAAIIALLWNPSTGRAHGSTNTLTAWMSGGIDPNWTGKKWDMARSHRHTVAAVNYAVSGNWKTIVERQEILWGPGDLVLTAPPWAAHSNGRCDREAYTFTIQDNALHGAINTTVMQEYLNRPPLHLGARPGFKA